MIDVLQFEQREQAAAALADRLEALLSRAISERGQASLVVSGGTTPVGMFHLLRRRPLAWNRVTVVASDERVVPMDHPDRNEAMIRREFLQEAAAEAQQVSLLPAGTLPERFDAVVLGMGADGHTASLFPDSPDLQAALGSAQPLVRLEVPSQTAPRISLTPAALLASERIHLLFFGRDKYRVLRAALSGDDATQYPVRVVTGQQQVPVRVYYAP